MESNCGNDFIIFKTERLYIREFNIDDVDSVYEYFGDPETTFFMDWGPGSYDEAKNFVLSALKHQISEPRKAFEFAVCLSDNGKLIGTVSLYLDDNLTQGSLGYILNKNFHHCGYMHEAISKMLAFGFLNLNLHRIYAICDSQNQASENVMRCLSMRKEGQFKSSIYMKVGGRSQWRSQCLYAMLQKEYLLALV